MTSIILSKKTASVFCWEAAHQYFPAQKVLVKVKKKLVNDLTVVEYRQGQTKKYVYE